MPRPTYREGRRDRGRVATYDPYRGDFVSMARPDEAIEAVPDRRRGLRLSMRHMGPDHLGTILVRGHYVQSLSGKYSIAGDKCPLSLYDFSDKIKTRPDCNDFGNIPRREFC